MFNLTLLGSAETSSLEAQDKLKHAPKAYALNPSLGGSMLRLARAYLVPVEEARLGYQHMVTFFVLHLHISTSRSVCIYIYVYPYAGHLMYVPEQQPMTGRAAEIPALLACTLI